MGRCIVAGHAISRQVRVPQTQRLALSAEVGHRATLDARLVLSVGGCERPPPAVAPRARTRPHTLCAHNREDSRFNRSG